MYVTAFREPTASLRFSSRALLTYPSEVRILMRSGPTASWQVIDSLRYEDEAELQKLLADDPTLIPVADIRRAAH
jgi:hypothetical protein